VLLLLGAVLALASGCGDYPGVWREQRLPSGGTVKVTAFNLVWGADHDEHALGGDCFSLEFVSADPGADPAALGREAQAVFELVRPVSELWGFRSAQLAGFPTPKRKGPYALYLFTRGADGRWTYSVERRKVFASD